MSLSSERRTRPAGFLGAFRWGLLARVLGLFAVLAIPLPAQATPAGCTPRWSLVPSAPIPAGTARHYSVHGAGDEIWAVGNTTTHDASGTVTSRTPLAERWDGQQMSPTVFPSDRDVRSLFDLVAVGSDDVWAIGTTSTEDGVVAHWDGVSWQVTGLSTIPDSIAATGPDDVWVMGHDRFHTDVHILHYNGITWTSDHRATAAARAGTEITAFIDLRTIDAIKVDGTLQVMAVGSWFSNTDLQRHTLAILYDGLQWRAIPTPDGPPGTSSILGQVSFQGPNDAWATGYEYVGTSDQGHLHRWDGTTWTSSPLPSSRAGADFLGDIDAHLGPPNVWAVGTAVGGNGRLRSVAERWDGQAWSQVSSPDRDRALVGLAAVAPDDVWVATADRGPSETTSSLLYRYGTAACRQR